MKYGRKEHKRIKQKAAVDAGTVRADRTETRETKEIIDHFNMDSFHGLQDEDLHR